MQCAQTVIVHRCWRSNPVNAFHWPAEHVHALHSHQRCVDPKILSPLSLWILIKNPQQCPQCIMLHLNDTPELIADLLQCRSTVTKMMIIDSDRWSECKLEKNDSEIWIIICKGNFNWQGRVRVRIKVKDIGSGLSFWLVSRLLDQLAKILQFQLRKLGIIRLACQMVANWRYQFFACYCQITDLMLTQN